MKIFYSYNEERAGSLLPQPDSLVTKYITHDPGWGLGATLFWLEDVPSGCQIELYSFALEGYANRAFLRTTKRIVSTDKISFLTAFVSPDNTIIVPGLLKYRSIKKTTDYRIAIIDAFLHEDRPYV
ncbi:hypothetical protein [Pseudomonas sichuanensis]|uniref:Uncharacterized protein n=1 Tax=Pseudomonas sichuanensis TaxID=2213015 RepID=A0ABV0DB76_9PSED